MGVPRRMQAQTHRRTAEPTKACTEYLLRCQSVLSDCNHTGDLSGELGSTSGRHVRGARKPARQRTCCSASGILKMVFGCQTAHIPRRTSLSGFGVSDRSSLWAVSLLASLSQSVHLSALASVAAISAVRRSLILSATCSSDMGMAVPNELAG